MTPPVMTKRQLMKLCFSAILHNDSNHLLGDVDRGSWMFGRYCTLWPSPKTLKFLACTGSWAWAKSYQISGQGHGKGHSQYLPGGLDPAKYIPSCLGQWLGHLHQSNNNCVIISRFYNTLSHTLVKAHDKVDYWPAALSPAPMWVVFQLNWPPP